MSEHHHLTKDEKYERYRAIQLEKFRVGDCFHSISS